MRLLYASSSTLPSTAANSVQVAHMCDAFAGAGHDVLLLGRPGATDRTIGSWYGTRHDFAVETSAWSANRGIGLVLTARRTAARTRSWGADVAYGRDPVGLLGAARAGVPVIYEVHHPPETARRALVERALLRSRALTRVVAITSALAERYRQAVPAAVDVLAAHDAADDPGAPSAAPAGPPVVGYCGSLRPGKGGEVIVHLARKLPSVAFEVVGGSPEDAASLRRLAPPNLTVVGPVAPAEVSHHLRRFTVALAPYGETVRGAGTIDLAPWMSPLKVYEYLAHGLPIVASDLPVLREVLVAGSNAELVVPGDPTAWVDTVRRLLDDDQRREQLSAAARRCFLDGHSWEARAAAVLHGVRPLASTGSSHAAP